MIIIRIFYIIYSDIMLQYFIKLYDINDRQTRIILLKVLFFYIEY